MATAAVSEHGCRYCYLTSAMVAVGEMSMSKIEVPRRVRRIRRNRIAKALRCLFALTNAEQQTAGGAVSASSAATVAVCRSNLHSLFEQ